MKKTGTLMDLCKTNKEFLLNTEQGREMIESMLHYDKIYQHNKALFTQLANGEIDEQTLKESVIEPHNYQPSKKTFRQKPNLRKSRQS